MKRVLEEYDKNKHKFRDQYISVTQRNLTINYKAYIDDEGYFNYEGFLTGINTAYNRVDFRVLVMSPENCEVIEIKPQNVVRSVGPFDFHFKLPYEPEKIANVWWRLYQS
jgi:hypothetical protein